MSFWLGLTGSIGMGKSTTAAFFRELGCDVWDADAAVHRLYSQNGDAVASIREVFPSAIEDNAVSRSKLRAILQQNKSGFEKIEHIVHPLVAQDRQTFAEQSLADILVFDIPLLFETGGNKRMNAVASVYVDAETQKKRVLDRGTMSEDDLTLILQKQIPIEEKLNRSDYVIHTDTLEHAQRQVREIISEIQQRIA